MPGYSSLVGTRADAVTYFVGSIFFTSAAYLQYLECISTATNIAPDAPSEMRFFTFEIRRIDWWATVVQLAGTLFFNVSHLSSPSTRRATAKRADLVVWSPDAFGSICFLVASQLAYAEAGHRWISGRPRDRGRQIAALNMLGSIFFGISAIAGWVVPSTGDLLDAALEHLGHASARRGSASLIGAALLLPEAASGQDG